MNVYYKRKPGGLLGRLPYRRAIRLQRGRPGGAPSGQPAPPRGREPESRSDSPGERERPLRCPSKWLIARRKSAKNGPHRMDAKWQVRVHSLGRQGRKIHVAGHKA